MIINIDNPFSVSRVSFKKFYIPWLNVKEVEFRKGRDGHPSQLGIAHSEGRKSVIDPRSEDTVLAEMGISSTQGGGVHYQGRQNLPHMPCVS